MPLHPGRRCSSCTPSLDETGHVLARGRKVYLAASRASWNTELAHRCSRLGWVSGRDFRGVEHERARGAAGDQRGLGVTAHKRRGPRIYTWGSPPLRPHSLSLVLLFLLYSSPFHLLVAAARRALLLHRRRVRHIAPAVVPTAVSPRTEPPHMTNELLQRQNCQSQPEDEVACKVRTREVCVVDTPPLTFPPTQPAAARRPHRVACTSLNTVSLCSFRGETAG